MILDIDKAFEKWIYLVQSKTSYVFGANHCTLVEEVNENNGFDCSSFVWFGLMQCEELKKYIINEYDGFLNKFACFTTNTMRQWFSKLDCICKPYSNSTELERGDILLFGYSDSKFYHTNVYFGDNKIIGAEDDTTGIVVKNFNSKNLQFYFRFKLENSQNLILSNYDLKSVCAILGNMARESNCNPTLQEVGGRGYGLIQWTPSNGSGKDLVKNLSKKIGLSVKHYDSLHNQLNIVNAELIGKLDGWYSTSDYPYSSKDFIHNKNQYDLEWLTKCYCFNRERAGVTAINERVEWANKFYKKFVEDINYIKTNYNPKSMSHFTENLPDNAIVDFSGYPIYVNDSSYLSENEIMWNASIIFIILTKGVQINKNNMRQYERKKRSYKPWKYINYFD